MSERTNALLGRLRQLSQAYHDDANIFTLGDLDEFLTKFDELDQTMSAGEEWPSGWKAEYLVKKLKTAEADLAILESTRIRKNSRLDIATKFSNDVAHALMARDSALAALMKEEFDG